VKLSASTTAAPAPTASPRLALFAYGFRPFFLFAGIIALAYIPWWVGSVALGWPLSTTWAPMLWHAHEMLFGFIVAAIAGFLLTAVPSWTGQRGFAGRPLAGLFALWLAGRLAILASGQLPSWLPSAIDLAFLPTLAGMIAGSLLRARNRNWPLLGVLGLLWACNVLFHVALLHLDVPLAARAVRIGIDVVLVLVTLIAGRTIPSFTSNAMKAVGHVPAHRPWSWLTPATLVAMIAAGLADALVVDGALGATVALVAAALHIARLFQWRAPLKRMTPIVWVLHLAYAWLPIGLVLRALMLLTGGAVAAFWLHALTIGAVTLMIAAVMTRASLGHTGRPLVVAPATTASYLLILSAAAARVFGLGAFGMRYPLVLVLSGLLWLAGFSLYLVVYGPILSRARADGHPG
jgi:uncharacterized protein involved in response to NO